MDASAVNPDLLSVARSLLLDREAAVAIEALRAAGVPSILLKGASIATWLYNDGVARPYLDVDLLVSPSQFCKATQVLADLGYAPRLIGADPAELGPRELDLIGPSNVSIDLHHGLLGLAGPPERSWQILARRTVTMRLAGADVCVLDVPARAMHLALHAAQNGPVDVKAVTDLERGLAMVHRADWEEAARLAGELEATEAFAAGLRLVRTGRVIADDLALTRRMTVELALRIQSAPSEAIFFERLSEARWIRGKTALLARKLFPTSAWLRANSALALRGPPGLICARLLHPLSVATRLVPAFRAWYRARKATGGYR